MGKIDNKIYTGEIMANLYSTKQKIALAQSVIENACGNNSG
jgi:hypothetical protein